MAATIAAKPRNISAEPKLSPWTSSSPPLPGDAACEKITTQLKLAMNLNLLFPNRLPTTQIEVNVPKIAMNNP